MGEACRPPPTHHGLLGAWESSWLAPGSAEMDGRIPILPLVGGEMAAAAVGSHASRPFSSGVLPSKLQGGETRAMVWALPKTFGVVIKSGRSFRELGGLCTRQLSEAADIGPKMASSGAGVLTEEACCHLPPGGLSGCLAAEMATSAGPPDTLNKKTRTAEKSSTGFFQPRLMIFVFYFIPASSCVSAPSSPFHATGLQGSSSAYREQSDAKATWHLACLCLRCCNFLHQHHIRSEKGQGSL